MPSLSRKLSSLMIHRGHKFQNSDSRVLWRSNEFWLRGGPGLATTRPVDDFAFLMLEYKKFQEARQTSDLASCPTGMSDETGMAFETAL